MNEDEDNEVRKVKKVVEKHEKEIDRLNQELDGFKK